MIGEPVKLEWFNPQGERIVSSQRVALHTGEDSSRLTIYNAVVEDAGIYRCQATDAQGQTQEATMVLEMYRECHLHAICNRGEHTHHPLFIPSLSIPASVGVLQTYKDMS